MGVAQEASRCRGSDTTPKFRRSYEDDFKAEAVQMLLDSHSAQSIIDRLRISQTHLLCRITEQSKTAV